MEMTDRQAASFVRSSETAQIIDIFERMLPGSYMSVESLQQLVNFNLNECAGNIQRARSIILLDGNGVVDKVKGGWRKLTHEEAVKVAAKRYSNKATRAGKRGERSLCSVDYESLAPETQVEHNVRLSMLGALKLVMSPRSRRKLGEAVVSAGRSLPDTETLKLFERVR